ncbi:MAG: glycosyltransferase [Crocinitomicaceae bacterium]|nr:glycosyltransferase [Crocinitomicaceae bacterium]
MSELPSLVIVLSRFPYPLEKGDKLRSYYQIRELTNRYAIHLIAISDVVVKESDVKELEQYCKTITIYKISKWSILFNSSMALLGNKPIQVGYFYNYFIYRKIQKQLEKIKPTHIFSQLIRTTEYTKNYLDCPKTLDYMDAFSKGFERRAEKAPWYSKWFYELEHRRLLVYERIMFDYFDKKTIISEQDKRYIFHPEREKIICVPNGIDESFFESNNRKKEYDFVFVGNMNYPPNIEAVTYIIKEILPTFSSSKFLIAGANPHPKLKRLAEQNPMITVSGWMEDIRDAYASAKVFLAPMKTGTGMQNKLLEAMAMGLPCITSTLANNAIGAVNKESIVVCDSTETAIIALNLLLQNESERTRIGQAGSEFVKQHFSWETSTKKLI